MLSAAGTEMAESDEGVDIESVKCILQADHEQVQKRTFTNWVNAQLAKHETPSVVQDLFQDLRDGYRLLDLLEVLSGQQLDRERDRSNPIHWRSNIETVLKFLRKKSIKLVNINIPDVVEGKPTIVLGMIWSIILHFHIEELASGLQFNSRQTQVEPSLHFNSSPTTSPPRKRKPLCHAKWKVSAKKALLQWVQEKAKGLGINVHNFSTSWRSGLAFIAIINALRPGLLDPQEFKHKSDGETLEIAFKVAEQELKIPRLLEAQDVDVCSPDPKSIITYVSQFLQYSQTGELKTQCSSGSDQHEAGIRERSAQQVGSGTDQSDHLGSEDSAQSAAAKAGRVIREAPAKLRAAQPSGIIQTDIQGGEIPGQSTEWISIRIDDLERDGHTQSVQEAPTGKIQSDWLQSSLSSQSMTHYPIGKEPLADVGECSGQLLSRDVSPSLPREDFAQLLARFLTVEGQATDQARGNCAQVDAASPRRQVVALAPEHSGQQAEDLLTGKCEVDRFPRVDITQLAEEPQGGQGQSDVPPRGESAPLASEFPSEQHQGDLQTREAFAHLQKESTMWKAQVIPRTGDEAVHVAGGPLIQQQQPMCQVTELGKKILTAELCLTGEDRGEGLTLSGDEKADRGFVRLAAVAQGQSDQAESQESLTGGEQGKDLTLSDKSSLIVAEKTDSRTKEPSVRWVTTMLREEADSPVREECASSATGNLTRKEQAYGLPGENSDQLPINEQSQVHTQTTGNTVQFLSGRGQTYGLPRQAPPRFVGASQSEQHQVLTRVDSAQYTPEFVCEQEQTGSPATEGPAQLAKYLLFGMDQAYGLAVEDCKLSAVSVSARNLTEDQASQGLAQLLKPSPVGEDKFDHPTNEEPGQLSQLILSGDIQACGLSGEDSEQLLSESLSEQEADADLAREDSSRSGSDRLMERVLKGREKEDISQSWEDRLTGKGQTFGPLAVDSREIFLRERELAGSMTTRTSDPLAAVTVSGQLQDHDLPREDSVPPAEEPLNERGQAYGLVRKDSAGAGKDSLNGDEQIDSTISVPELIQFQSDWTNTRERLAGGDQGEDLTLSQEGPLTGAEQSDTQTRNISVNRESVTLREQEQEGDPKRAECAPSATGDVTGKERAYSRPREDSDQLLVSEQSQAHTQATGNTVQFQSEPGQNYGLPRQAPPPSVAASQSEQHQVLTRDVSAQYPPEIVSEQEQTGGAITQKDQSPGLSLSAEGALSGKCTEDSVQSAEMILHEPEQAGDWECGKSTQLLEELLSWEGQARVALAESAPVLQIGEDQANKPESESFPHWILLHQNLKEVEDSAPSLSYSPNAGEQSAADSAVLLSRQGQGNRLVQEDTELLEKEPVATKALSGVKSSQPLKKPLDGNNSTDILAREDSGKSALSMKQEFAGDLKSSSVDLSETRQQDKETEEEEDQSIAGNEEKEGDIDAVNEISQRYETAKETFESSLKRVEGLIVMDLHSQPTISGLWEKFQEMQAARAEVTSLLSAFDAVVTELQRLPVAAPHTRISETNRLRGESAELLQTLHHREEFLSMALNVLETVEQQLTQLHNSLLQFQNKPKILTGLNLKHEPDLQMLKNLQTQIKSQIESCEDLQSTECEASVTLDRGDHRAVCAVALGYTQKCQEIGLQVQVAEEALRALDGFLQLLRAVEHKEGSVWEQEGAVLAGKVRLEEEKGTRPLQDRALELDETLTAAKIFLEDGNSGGRTCCWDLAVSLGYKAEGARLGLDKEESAAQEGLHKTFCTRQSHLINVLRQIERSAGEVQLSEATLPGVQQRLRSLNDLNSNLHSKAAELSELRELTEQLIGMNSALRGEAQEGLDTVEKVWEETERNIHDWQDQCCVLVAFLREFQNYKKDITSTIQKGEEVIPERSSYMGKEKLQRVMCNIDKVHLEFSIKQEKVDELRKICRHLQSELRKVMDSESLPFQGEADELLDQWLDVAERLDSYSCSLKHAMSLWDQLTETGTRMEEWVKRKAENLGASMSGQELAWLEEEIQFQEQEIQSFHEKATRIQELLEWEEVPLELQVVESTVRKKMEQINCTKNQLSAGNEELSGGLGQSGARLQTLTASLASHIGEENPQILCDPQDRPPASESRVGGQQCFQHSLGEHKEPVQSREDPTASSDDEVTPTAEELPQVPRMVLEQSHKPSSDGQRPGDTDLRRRQHEALEEVRAAKRCRESQELQMEGDWIRLSAAKHLLDTLEAKQENVERYPEKLREYVTDCRQLSDLLDTLETSLKGCAAEIPTSYKAAIEQVERQAGLGREIDSIETMLVDLKNRAVNLEQTGEAGSLAVSRLSDHWLCLQDSARKQELYSRNQRKEWKTMSEQIDRVTIVLDHLQDDLPDGPWEQATEAQLQALEEYVSRYADDLKRQQSALAILVCRVTSVLGVQDASDQTLAPPVLQELRAMEDRCRSLTQKIEKSRRGIEEEVQEREKIFREINWIGDWLQQAQAQLESINMDSDGEAENGLEQLRDAVNAQQQAMAELSGQLQNRYSARDTTIPAEIATRIQETSRALGDMEGKLKALGPQKTRSQELSFRIKAIRSRLQNFEEVLQQRSKSHSEAKAQQKRIWREIDEWHSVLSQLDAEVQDLAEQDPEQAQELMESLLDPFQQHQQVSRIAEQRTTRLSKIPECLEEYKQITDSAASWIESTEALLSSETDYTSAKSLGQQLLAFQLTAESGRQKQNGLQDIASRLKDLSVMYEAGEMMERLSELGEIGNSLQQAIDQKLADMEHFVTEIGDIEAEVKIIESKLLKINTILSSVNLCDLPILEHLENRQIILENLEEMKDLVGVMKECKESLGLPEEVVCTVEAFTKVARLTVELTHLQELTTQQSTMLQSLSEKLQEYDTAMERLQEGCEFSIEVQCERLADLTKQKELLLNNTQEALTRLVQEEQACEQPVDEGCTEDEQPFTADNNQPRDSQVFPDGKLPSLMEEDEDNEEDENTIESAERNRTPVTLPDSSPAPLEELHVYRERAAALERWLDTAPESLGGSGCDQEMQRVVEEHLLQSQSMLLEIEQKVCELAQAGQKGGSTAQPELESLSLRLRTLKDTLVNYQAKLQSEAQGAHTKEIAPANETTSLLLPSGQLTSPVTKPRLSRQDSLQQQKELEMELTEHKQLTEYIARHADRMWQQNQGPNREEQEPARPTTKDSGDILPLGNVMPVELRVPGEVPDNHVTWLHLQRETEGHLRLLEDSLRQGLGSQVTVTARSLHRARGISSASPLAAEELNSWLTQLQELGREAAAIATQGEGHINEAECLKLEKIMQNGTSRISHWLDAVEEGMCSYRSIPIEEAEQELHGHQLLSDTLERVCRELSEQRCLLGQSDVFGDQICPVALECLGNLQHRLKLLQSFHSTVSQSLRDGARQITQYQVRLRQLEAALLQRRTDAQKRLVESAGRSTGEQLQLIEEMECGLESLEEQLLALIAEGEQYDLEPSATQDICSLEEVLDDTRMCLREQRREVRQRLVLASQYECLVQGLSGLVDSGQEKVIQEASPLTKSIGDLRSHLQNYKHFFRSLANHLILLEQFSQNIPESIVARNRDFRLELVEEVTALQSQALLHGVQMETTLQAWTEFEVDYSFLMKEMEMLNSAVPSVELVEETEERLAERVGTFQRIRKSLDGNQPRVDQALRNGKALLTTLNSPELEGQLGTLQESWSSLRNQVNDELQRLEMLLEHGTRFQRESHEVGHWLESARSSLRSWEQESVSLTVNPETTGKQLNLFLEFWKEVEGMSSSKTSAVSTGSQLLALKQAEGSVLRARLTQLEQEWAQLIARLPGIQEKLHQLQMETLPSRLAITQLRVWIHRVETSMQADEAVTRVLGSSTAVKIMLQKYKDYKMDLSCRQLTVDFVNQSVLQMSSQDVERDRYGKMDFAESLGFLNVQWQRLTRQLNGKMLDLEMLLERWMEYERVVKLLSSWFKSQGERLRIDRKACSHTALLNALSHCQELSESLKVKETELERLRETVPLATESIVPETLINTTKKLDQLHDSWRNLDTEVKQLDSILTSRLQLWTTYQDSYEEVNGNILRAGYSLEHCTPLSSSLEAVRIQVESLQALQDMMECGEDSCREFQEASQKLTEKCNPPLAQLLKKKCEDTRNRWLHVNQDVAEQLHSARTVFQLWKQFSDMYRSAQAKVKCSETGCWQLLAKVSVEDSNQDRLQSWFVEAQESVSELRTLQEDISPVCVAADELATRMDTSSSVALQSESRYLSGRVSHLEALMSLKIPDIQGLLEQHEEFHRSLLALETLVNESEEVLKSDDSSKEEAEQTHMEIVKDQLLRLSSASVHLETLKHLSDQLPLSDLDYRRVQALNQRWEQARTTALDRCSKLQAIRLQKENFGKKCEQWRQFLEKMEEGLMVDVASSYEGLKEQQETHELFQAEVSIAHQILDSLLTEALHLIPAGEVKDSTFTLNLSALKERWHGLVRKVRQRQDTIRALANQWRCHGNSLAKLHKLLTGTSNQLGAMDELSCHNLPQLWRLVEDVKHQERNLQRHNSRYVRTLEAGRELLSTADSQTQASLEGQVCQLQEAWESTSSQLKDKRIELTNIEKVCDRCGEEVNTLGLKLQELRVDVKRDLPSSSEDLQREQNQLQELGGTLQSWTNRLVELSKVKADLGKHLVPDTAVGFKEQVAILESQWEQLRLAVSLRTLEINDRLEQWVVFNAKCKRLEDWLQQMEDRVSQNPDSGVEEMIERLQKDCVEEINLYKQNNAQLKQLGNELIKASSTSKASEIDNKLHLINSHWQHLHEVIEARVKKLKDTLCSVQLLDREMSNLRTWLSRIESELSKPVVYNICDDQEIEKKLAEQQELQRDIEQHSVGVTSVLSLCDSLLLDTDTETECNSIQQTTRSLDRRWRNICAMSVERRMKIEETWRLWQKFLDDYSRFEDWLKAAERIAAQPNSSQVLYSLAKEELKKFETFQRQIHESLTQLELINKQYRRLARENRTDSSSRLKQMVHEGNQRWDSLQKRIAAILRRLKHFTNQREEFETSREGILVWLTEMDLQLTNVEHFSESDIDDKVRQLNAFQQEITLNTNKIDQLIDSGEQLIQKIEPMDAIAIEEELEELHGYCQEVFGRVARFHQRLMTKRPMIDEDKDLSDREADREDGGVLQNMSWQEKARATESSALDSLCHLSPPGQTQQNERSGRETPVSVDSIPLEWDHTVDLGGSSSHDDEEDSLYFSTLSDIQITESPEAYVKMTESALGASAGDSGPDSVSWHPATTPEGTRKCQSQQTEITVGHRPTTGGQGLDAAHREGYVKLLSECSRSIDGIRRAPGILGDEVSQPSGLMELAHSEQQAAGIKRWDLLHAQALSEELLIKQNLQQWQQLTSDLDDISAWLSHIEPALNQAQDLEPKTRLHTIQEKLRSLRNIQKEFDKYKALVISVNLSSREFLQTDSAEAQELQQKLHQVNGNWNRSSQSLEQWRTSLRSALIQCQDFHCTTYSLLMWLADCERRRGLVQLSDPGLGLQTLTKHHKELMNLEAEMLGKQPQVNTLQEISKHLLESGEGAEWLEAKEKVHVIGNKLKLMLGEITADLRTVNERLDTGSVISANELDFAAVPMTSSPLRHQVVRREVQKNKAPGVSMKRVDGEVRNQGVSKVRSFLSRVFRAAIPLQLLILLLLLLACLIPFSQEDYNCALANNFARSLYPMLRYTNGPPPT